MMSMVEEKNFEVPSLPLSGVICAALTPLGPSLEPDLAEVPAHCERLLANGCDGINLLGTTGEATSLTSEQRLRVMSAVAEARLPLDRFMVGTGAAALGDAVRLTAHAAALGFAGALVVPPFYFKNLGDEGVFRFYAELIERVADARLKLYFYNFPQLSGVTISPEVIERVSRAYPGVAAGIKDSSGSRPYAAGLARRFPRLAVFPSSETELATARDFGFAGCISATVNVTAPIASRVWRSEKTAAGAASLRAIRTTIASFPLVPALRYLTSLIREDERWRRPLPPLQALAPADCAALDDELAAIPAYSVAAERLAR